jgi:oxygen-independent coproporphyrinogen-3 oxidase
LFAQQSADAVYVHIPFCPHKCFYCDFNSYVAEEEQTVWKYLQGLAREMELTVTANPPDVIRTIFIGGGTPSMLDPQQMEFLFAALHRSFPIRAADLEMTMEANPGTIDEEKLATMKAGGVNRISFGAQTFDERLLKDIGRIHGASDVGRSIQLAREAGFENLSIDLMFGLPGQTLEMVRSSLQVALSFELPHISLYGLKIEENTLFHTLYMRNQLVLPDEDEELAMYVSIMETVRAAGYEQYEISNFAKSGYASRHNIAYWQNRAYYGLGAGAHGYMNGERHVNVKAVQAYIQAASTGLSRRETFVVSAEEAMEDFMMVGLRMLAGVDRREFMRQFSCDWDGRFGSVFANLLGDGLLVPTDYGFRLSEQGIVVGNEVFARFLS